DAGGHALADQIDLIKEVRVGRVDKVEVLFELLTWEVANYVRRLVLLDRKPRRPRRPLLHHGEDHVAIEHAETGAGCGPHLVVANLAGGHVIDLGWLQKPRSALDQPLGVSWRGVSFHHP